MIKSSELVGSGHLPQRASQRPRDIRTNKAETSNKKLTKKDYNRPDIIEAKQTELEKFFEFNAIETVPWGAEIMRTTWVVTEKTDHLSKTGSKIKSRLCTIGNSSEEF